jgi:hypothetical protein
MQRMNFHWICSSESLPDVSVRRHALQMRDSAVMEISSAAQEAIRPQFAQARNRRHETSRTGDECPPRVLISRQRIAIVATFARRSGTTGTPQTLIRGVCTRQESAMLTPRIHREKDPTKQAPPRSEQGDGELADELDNFADEASAGLEELSFDDESRSDRHHAIGNAQSAQNDNAPEANIDELDDGNDIGEQGEQ